MSSPIEPFLRQIRVARRRLVWQAFLNAWVRLALLGAGGLLAWGAARRFLHGELPWDLRDAGIAFGAAAFAAVCLALLRRPALGAAAAELDRRADSRDRFVTGLSIGRTSERGPFAAAALGECAAFAESMDAVRWFPVRLPREALWMIAPLLSLALLQWDAGAEAERRGAAKEAGQAEVAPTADRLERLAEEAREKAGQQEDPALKALAEKLRQAASDLRAEATDREEGAKAALRALSRLEQVLQDLQKTPSAASPEELKALAQQLAKEPATKEAAEALEQGRLGDAAQALEQASKKDAPSAAEAEKRLQEALQHLAEQRQHSQALEQMMDELRKDGGKGAMQKLAQMLQQMNGQTGQGAKAQGRPGRQATLQEMLAALQSLKYGQPSQSPQQKPGDPSGGGSVAMEDFGKRPGQGQGPQGDAGRPTGQPGSERDTGTTPTPFGERPEGEGEKGADIALKGRLGEGESLSVYAPAAGDQSKAQRRYRELYDALAPEAREAVLQEAVPLGSRFFIQRYFEAIRPPR